jgi:hypothetical protein
VKKIGKRGLMWALPMLAKFTGSNRLVYSAITKSPVLVTIGLEKTFFAELEVEFFLKFGEPFLLRKIAGEGWPGKIIPIGGG